MQAAVSTAEHRISISGVDRPAPGPGQLLLAVEASGICGSDLHALEFLGAGMTPGHEFVGRVQEVGESVTGFKVGERVTALPVISCKRCKFCLSGDPIHCPEANYFGSGDQAGSFADFVVVDAQASVVVPESIPLDSAATIEPVSIGLNVIERAGLKPGDRLLVMGGGPIGLAVTLWARAMGVATIVVSDPVESRRNLALQMGATHAVDPLTQDLAEFFLAETGGLP